MTLPVVFLTGEALSESEQREADAYLMKPFSRQQLVDTMRRLTGCTRQ